MNKRVKFIFLFAFISFAILSGLAFPRIQDLSIEEVVGKSTMAVVKINVYDKTGEKCGFGTGFFIAPGKILTCAHVIESAHSLSINPFGHVDVITPYNISYGHPKILKANGVLDLALLEVDALNQPSLSLETGEKLIKGQPVVTVGNPEEYAKLASIGIVSEEDAADPLTFYFSAPVGPGSSGSPILNMKGNLIGIVMATKIELSFINIAIKTERISEFLSSPDNPKPLAKARSRLFWPTILSKTKSAILSIINPIFYWGWWLFRLLVKILSLILSLIMVSIITFIITKIAIYAFKKAFLVIIALFGVSLWGIVIWGSAKLFSSFIDRSRLIFLSTLIIATLAGSFLYFFAKRILVGLRRKQKLATGKA